MSDATTPAGAGHACRPGLGLGATALLLSACALNPYIPNTRPYPAPSGASTPHQRLEYALAYADRTYDAYSAKLVEEQERQRGLGGTLITLGAVTLGLGAFNAHRDALMATALGGGYAYALGTWNSSQGRPGIYVEGMKAVSCAKAAIAPLRIGDTQLLDIRDRAQATTTAVERASRSAGEVTHWLSLVASQEGAGPPSALVSAAGAELTALGETLNRANELLARAANIEQRVSGVGALLETRIDDIRQRVDDALRGSLADLSTLPQVVGSLSSYANVFVPGLNLGAALDKKVAASSRALDKGPKPTAESATREDEIAPLSEEERKRAAQEANPADQLARSLGRLRAHALILSMRASQLHGAVETMTMEQAKAALAGCNVDPARAGTALRLERTALRFAPGTAGTALVPVSGGTQPYAASLLDLPAKGLNVSIAGSTAVLVTADTTTEAGRSYQVRVSDAAGASSALTVSIEGAGNGTGGSGGSGGSGGQDNKKRSGPSSQSLSRSSGSGSSSDGGGSGSSVALADFGAGCTGHNRPAEQICLLQAVLDVGLSGKLDDATCRAFRDHAATRQFEGRLNDSAVAALKTRAQLPTNAGHGDILARLAELKKPACPGATARPSAKVPPAPALASCPPVGSGRQCPVAGVEFEFECQLSAEEVGDIRGRLGMSRTPERFDKELRERLMRFQQELKLKNQIGCYDSETAAALQKRPRP